MPTASGSTITLILTRVRYRGSNFSQTSKINFVRANRNRLLVVWNRTRRWCSGHLFVCSWDSAVTSSDSENTSERWPLLPSASNRRADGTIVYTRPWTQASKTALTDSSLAAERRAEALHILCHSDKHLSPIRWPTAAAIVYTLVRYVTTKDARWERCSFWSLRPSPRRRTASCRLALEMCDDCVRTSWGYW